MMNRQISQGKSRGMEAPSVTEAHLVFSVDGQPYACPIAQVDKLLARDEAHVEAADLISQPWWGGFLVDGGETLPLVSVRGLWALKPFSSNFSGGRGQAILVCRDSGGRVALLLDSCSGVVPLPTHARTGRAVPRSLTRGQGACFQTLIQWQGRLLMIVDLNQLLPDAIRLELAQLREGKPTIAA